MEEWRKWQQQIEDRLAKLEQDDRLKRLQIESESMLAGIDECRKKNSTPFLELIEQAKLLSDENLYSLIANLE